MSLRFPGRCFIWMSWPGRWWRSATEILAEGPAGRLRCGRRITSCHIFYYQKGDRNEWNRDVYKRQGFFLLALAGRFSFVNTISSVKDRFCFSKVYGFAIFPISRPATDVPIVNAVSYTHLEVYKRQSEYRSKCSWVSTTGISSIFSKSFLQSMVSVPLF